MSGRQFGHGKGRLSLRPLVGSATDLEIAARVGRTERQVAEARRRGLDLFEADEWAAHYDLHPVSVWGADWEAAVNSDPIVESVAVPNPDESTLQVWQRRKRGAPGVQPAFHAWDGSITAEPSGRPMSEAELAELGLDRLQVQEGEHQIVGQLVSKTPVVIQEASGRPG